MEETQLILRHLHRLKTAYRIQVDMETNPQVKSHYRSLCAGIDVCLAAIEAVLGSSEKAIRHYEEFMDAESESRKDQ